MITRGNSVGTTRLRIALAAFMAVFLLFGVGFVEAQTTAANPSGLAIPRFVSLRSNEVNLRTGPGARQPWLLATHHRCYLCPRLRRRAVLTRRRARSASVKMGNHSSR